MAKDSGIKIPERNYLRGPAWLIDGPGPFALLEELEDWRNECMKMLEQYPDHWQWVWEFRKVEDNIDTHWTKPDDD